MSLSIQYYLMQEYSAHAHFNPWLVMYNVIIIMTNMVSIFHPHYRYIYRAVYDINVHKI